MRGSVEGTVVFTGMALMAFAANSVLCRLALGDRLIDGASFTIVRLLSGAVVLALIVTLRGSRKSLFRKGIFSGSWYSSVMLFLYATTFSYAYLTLDTATGALILFGAVQIAMLLSAVMAGDRLCWIEWAGVGVAVAGFVYLMLPGATSPDIGGFVLMVIAGVAWAIYTLRGRGSARPLLDSAYHFIRTLPFVLVLSLVTMADAHYSAHGVWLAMVSGGVASGMGYAIWYVAIGGMSAIQASVVQLLVPLIAAIGGAIWIAEMVGLRLIVAGVMILGGILMVVLGRRA